MDCSIIIRKLLHGLFYACIFFVSINVNAKEYTIYVAEEANPAYAISVKQADGITVFAERNLQKALNSAAKLLTGDNAVSVLVAGGEYSGKLGQGIWNIPPINSPGGSLYLLGGWNSDFTKRNPFQNLTRLVTRYGRSGPILELGRNSQLANVVISGFVLDAGPSNKYDNGNNLQKSGSSTHRLISFGYLKTDHLVISDNVFVNAPQVVLDPYISPLTQTGEVEIINNFFINNVMPIQELSGNPVGRTTLNTIKLIHNSFILNWPYNPDPASSNVGAIGLYHKGGVHNIQIEGNLFAFNAGGAFQHDWPEDRMPKITIRKNLFYKNAALFDMQGDGDGVIVGKFGTNARYIILDIKKVEDSFDYTISENIALNPNIGINKQMLKIEIDEEDPEADHLIEGYAPAVDIEAGALPFATGAASQFGVDPDRLWKK